MTNATINALLEIPLPEYSGIILFPIIIFISYRANRIAEERQHIIKAAVWTHSLCLLSLIFFLIVYVQDIRLPFHRSVAGFDLFGSPSRWTSIFCIIDTIAAEIAGMLGRSSL